MKTSEHWQRPEGFADLVDTRWLLFDQVPQEVPTPIAQSSLRTFRGTKWWFEVSVREYRPRNDRVFS